MLELDLSQLISKMTCEKWDDQHIEIATDGIPARLYETLSSFSNQSGGGIIIFGIDKTEGFKVKGVNSIEELKKNILEQSMQMTPAVSPFFTVARINDKIVLSAEICECNTYEKPCFYKGLGKNRGSFVRIGDSNIAMTEYEIYSYESYKSGTYEALRCVNRASIEDFSKSNLLNYLKKLRAEKQNMASLDDNRILESHGMILNQKPTLAGLLMLGEFPQKFFPRLCIHAMIFKGSKNNRKVIAKKIEGTIPQMLDSSLAFVVKNLNLVNIADGVSNADKNDYPLAAIREILINSLIHRDYSVYTDYIPIRLHIYEDRLEIENPGGMYGNINANISKSNCNIRNPYIASAMEVILNKDSYCSGIYKINNELNNAGMPAPIFINRQGKFKVIIYKKIRSKKTDVNLEQEIIKFCITPRSRDELAEKFGFLTPNYFVKKYIDSLIVSGKIKLELPNKPQSKFQKYYA